MPPLIGTQNDETRTPISLIGPTQKFHYASIFGNLSNIQNRLISSLKISRELYILETRYAGLKAVLGQNLISDTRLKTSFQLYSTF